MIEIEGVRHQVGGAPILHGIDLSIPAGGLTALIGPNGAGKSTLLSLVARLAPLQAGRITVGGLEIGRAPDRDVARRLAIMPQSAEVSARVTVRELVGFGRHPWSRGRPGPEDRAAVEAAIARFDLAGLQDRFLDTLSGGQRQRAFVAMSFAQSTDVLLLDEPLNNLDIAAARSLMQELRRLAQEDGKTVVVVMHDINAAAAYADRVIAMKDGRIAVDGPPDAAVTPALLRDVFGAGAEVARVSGRPVVLI
ncbi:ABC transporter ATP-binding protein [Rhodovulum sp. DZ06]|uniref:iron ABC transporter ATP-binding protein n=1 Tax=Rhodovulum sp. DZ06 TaxID=3425126 RepID=UPI003D327A1E